MAGTCRTGSEVHKRQQSAHTSACSLTCRNALAATNVSIVLGVDDEPHWEDPDWSYTAEVEGLADRVKAADLVLVVFPVWWYSLPAMAKGYIDRVWNYRLLYGEGRRISAAMRWVGLVGWPEHALAKRGFDEMMVRHLNSGIAGFCGVEDTRVHLLFDSLEDPDVARFRKGARDAAIEALATLSHHSPSD